MADFTITSIHAREIIDSRGNPLADYAQRLREWSSRVLRQVATQVTAYTEPCRVTSRESDDRRIGVTEDLLALERL